VKRDALRAEISGGEPVVVRGIDRSIRELDVKLNNGVEISVISDLRILRGHFFVFLL
jgi:hypothetical protein